MERRHVAAIRDGDRVAACEQLREDFGVEQAGPRVDGAAEPCAREYVRKTAS
jgi:hypothetical protein